MTAMAGDVTGLPRGRALTRTDLDAMPDDGHRYELLDGMLVVSPASLIAHQRVLFNLSRLVADSAPNGLHIRR